MSDFPGQRTTNLGNASPRFRRSQFRAGNNGQLVSVCVVRRASARNGVTSPHRRFRGIMPEEVNGCRDDIGPCGRFSLACFCALRSPFRASARPSRRPRMIARGKALTEAGDCASCHTADPAKPFAGGKRIDTPVRRHLFAQPDAGPRHRPRRLERRRVSTARCATAWRPTARAIIPAFPYPNFTKLIRDDILAIQRLSRDADAGPQHCRRRRSCAGRFNYRVVMRGLELAVLQARHPRCRTSKRARNGIAAAIWSRAPAHCGACHTPKNIFGADRRGQAFGGGLRSRACSRRGSTAPSAAA